MSLPLDSTFLAEQGLHMLNLPTPPSAYPNACAPQNRHLIIFTQWINEWMDGWMNKLDTHLDWSRNTSLPSIVKEADLASLLQNQFPMLDRKRNIYLTRKSVVTHADV